MRKKFTKIGIALTFILLALFVYMYRVPDVPVATSGIPRYDIRRELHNLDGNLLTGYILGGGTKLSNNGRIVSRDIFKAHELVVRLRESTTTYPAFVAQGEKMHGLSSAANRFLDITYLDGIHEKFVRIPISPGIEDQYFGPVCGPVIADIWKDVSETEEDQLKGTQPN